MHLFSNTNVFKEKSLSILLALLPLSFVAGNLVINLNVILIIICTFIFFKEKVFSLKYYFLDFLIFFYFALIIFTGFINFYFFNLDGVDSYVVSPLKSILFIKYLLMYLILRFLVEKKLISLKYFFITCSLCSIFVCLDIFLQFLRGTDIFGYEKIGSGRKLSGPFGDELIAGGFIQRFSLFCFFLIPFFFQKYMKIVNLFIPFLFLIFFFGIVLSGNRMPMILFLMIIFLLVLFQKQTRKFLIPFIIIFSLAFTLIYNLNLEVKTNFNNFNKQIIKMKTLLVNKDFNNQTNTTYLREFSSFYETWKLNKYIGGGIKNFRFYCHHRKNIDKNAKFICNMHPHNYYLEIITETGVLGLIIILIIFFNIFYGTFIKKYFLNSKLRHNNLIIPFIFLFLAEIFPIKSTGSFFTTGNSTYLFLLIGILVGIMRKENYIENKDLNR
tara:strand:- start:2667 stop:3989 length:1323 start_codon:yes stop_codon:yes gene_type:complete